MMVAAVLCGFGGWGNSSGLQHEGCTCEVINLGDLLHFFFFPCSLSAHTQLLAMGTAFSSRWPIAQEGEDGVGDFLSMLM